MVAQGVERAKLQGTTNVETLINNLPQAFAGMTSGVSNGTTGTATRRTGASAATARADRRVRLT